MSDDAVAEIAEKYRESPGVCVHEAFRTAIREYLEEHGDEPVFQVEATDNDPETQARATLLRSSIPTWREVLESAPDDDVPFRPWWNDLVTRAVRETVASLVQHGHIELSD